MKEFSLQDLLEASDLCPFSYSGRSMYGKNCLAVTLDTGGPLSLAAQLLEAARDRLTDETEASVETLDNLIEVLQSARTDAMGRGTVFYFPEIPFVSEAEG